MSKLKQLRNIFGKPVDPASVMDGIAYKTLSGKFYVETRGRTEDLAAGTTRADVEAAGLTIHAAPLKRFLTFD